MSQPGSPDGGASGAAKEADALPRRRAFQSLRGALSASKLGLSSVVGLAGAFLALLPAAIERAPRGRAPAELPSSGPEAEASAEARREPLAG